MTKAILIMIGTLLLYFGYGCSPAGVLVTTGGSAMVVAEGDKSLGTVIDDASIKLNISTKFISSEDNLFVDIDVHVIEGRVLLTGIVENQEIRINSVKKFGKSRELKK